MRPPNELIISAKVPHPQTPVKQDKPKAYRSPLWAHLDEIHEWRLARETWEAIANKLALQYGLKVSFQAVHLFSNAQSIETAGGRWVLSTSAQVQ